MCICLSCASSTYWIKSELCVILILQLRTSPVGQFIFGCTRGTMGGGKVLGSESWASESWQFWSQEKLLICITYVPRWTRKLWKRWLVLFLHWMFLFELLVCVAPHPFHLHQKLHILWSWPTYRKSVVVLRVYVSVSFSQSINWCSMCFSFYMWEDFFFHNASFFSPSFLLFSFFFLFFFFLFFLHKKYASFVLMSIPAVDFLVYICYCKDYEMFIMCMRNVLCGINSKWKHFC